MPNGDQDYRSRIDELTAQGLDEDQIVSTIMSERGGVSTGPDPDSRWRERIRGVPGYERASQLTDWVADKGTALAGYARERLADPMSTLRGAPEVGRQALTGLGTEIGRMTAGAMRTVGELPGYGVVGRAGERLSEEAEAYGAERAPETGAQQVARGVGTIAPYIAAPAMAYRAGGGLAGPAVAEIAADWAGAAGSPEHTVAGMMAGIDPESEGIAGTAREFGEKYTGLYGGPEAVAESPVRAGASEAALFSPLSGLPLVKPIARAAGRGARATGRLAEGGIEALKALDDVGAVGRAVDDLPMDEASRMARAEEQGFDADVFHGTSRDNVLRTPETLTDPVPAPRTTDFDKFEWGTHVGTEEAANQRLSQVRESGAYADLPLLDEGVTAAADVPPRPGERVFPLKMRGDYLEVSEGKGWGPMHILDQAEQQGIVTKGEVSAVVDAPYKDHRAAATDLLENKGYQGIKYINEVEDPGSMSYMVFDPANLRSRTAAAFDPENIGKADLMGGVAADMLPGLTGPVGRTAARGAVGAGIGAGADEENRLRGALVGAATVAGGGELLARGLAGPEAMARLQGVQARRGATFDELMGSEGMVVPPGHGEGLPASGLRDPTEGLRQLPPSQEALAAASEVTLPGFNLDPSGTDRLNRHVARILDTSRDVDLGRATVTHAQTHKFAKEIGLNPRDIDKVAASRMTGAEMLATRDIISQNVTDLTKHENLLLRGLSDEGLPLSPSEIEQTQRLINALESQNDQFMRKFIKARSESGRNLNSLKILANRSLDPATWMAKAQRVKGSPLDEFQSLKLRGLLSDGNRVELAKFVGGLYDAPMSDKLVTLWKAGLLSNPATHLANITGNISMAVLETAKDAPAAFFDRIASTISDTRSKGGISLDVVKAGWDATDFRGAGRQVLTGQMDDAAMLSKYDIYKQVDFDNWAASGFLNAYAGPKSRIFASLQAGDKIFKSYALARSLAEQAQLMAKQEGLAGDALQSRVDELINTDASLHARAINDAEVATFLNKGGHTTFKGIDLAEAGEGLRRPLGAAGHVLAPFTRTPANIMDRVLEYSPVGALADLPKMADWMQKVRQGKKAGGLSADDLAEIMHLQRTMVEQAGRATLGTGVITMGYMLADMDLLSGNYPTEAADRNVYQLLNEQAHSLKVDGHWLSLDRLSPVGNLMTLGAELNRMVKDPEVGAGGAVMAAPAVVGKTVVEQSFLRGVQGALTALAEPDRSMARWVRQTAASGVPSAVYATARVIDPTLRDPQSVGEQVMSRLPGVSRMVTPSIDAFGGERVRAKSLTGRVAGSYGPLTMRESLEGDPTRAEVKRVGASIAPYRPRGVDRGTSEYEQLQREYGAEVERAVTRAMEDREYLAKENEARRLVEGNDPEYGGRDVGEVTLELQAEYLQAASRDARSRMTRERNRRRR